MIHLHVGRHGSFTCDLDPETSVGACWGADQSCPLCWRNTRYAMRQQKSKRDSQIHALAV